MRESLDGWRRAEEPLWLPAAGTAVLFAAAWLREPAVPYVLALLGATVVALLAGRAAGRERRRPWRWLLVASLVALSAVALATHWTLRRVDRAWPAFSSEATTSAGDRLSAALSGGAASLIEASRRALDAPVDGADAFTYLSDLNVGAGERAVVLSRDGRVAAWSGISRVFPDTSGRPLVAIFTPFYVALQATAQRGTTRATAVLLVHAEPPADRLAEPLDRVVLRRAAAQAFAFRPPGSAPMASGVGGGFLFAPGGTPLLVASPEPLVREKVRLRVAQVARERGAVLLALATMSLIAVVWRRGASLMRRLGALGVAAAVVAVAPLNDLSNATSLFDPTYYFAPLGGPFTASVGALGLTSALVLLGLLAVLRRRPRPLTRWAAVLVVLAIAGAGPFLLRDLARGIVPPAWGVTTELWLAWEVTLFLAAVSVLLAGASAGRAAMGPGRGISPLVPVTLAAAAALLAPLLWSGAGRWPGWYPVLWIGAIGTLALARRTRRLIVAAATVAGFGAATLVWGATSRGRVDLAARDVAGLQGVDEGVRELLERFGESLVDEPAPTTRAELLRRYVESAISATDVPVALETWSPLDAPLASLSLLGFDSVPGQVLDLARETRRSGRSVTRERRTAPGMGSMLSLAIPFPTGEVTTVLVGPRTRLLPDDPFASLLGLAIPSSAEPPYTVALVDADSTVTGTAPPAAVRWQREGTELHGDIVLSSSAGRERVHVEVELRSLDVLVERGALIVLLNIAIVAILWMASALGDGAFVRWLRLERRQWARSYRIRLTLVLFGFCVMPAMAFAIWSYRQLQADDRTSRELQVRETLRAVARAGDFDRLGEASDRLGSPLLLYRGGRLTGASDSLYIDLAPAGLFLPPSVALQLVVGGEVAATASPPVGGGARPGFFGYWTATAPPGERVVLAAPAHTNELMLDRRRRDLGVLVLFAMAVGALAALWLSGLAARELSRPIGALRRGALAIARGDEEPTLGAADAPVEFQPVFSAFRRMTADLNASRAALEEAQRRTAAVLRHAASGVIAVDAHGTISLANPRAERLLGRELPAGLPMSQIGAPGLEPIVRGFLEGTRREEAFDLEVRSRPVRGRLTMLERGGGAVVTLDDVSEVARAQRVLAWGEMARQIAHEIKNPLTPIRLGVQHLMRARTGTRVDFDAVLEQNVGRILAEIDRLDEIARAFSRYGRLPEEGLPAVPVDVAAVAQDIVELEALGGGAGAVSWSVTGADQPAPALARAEELREVLLNLMENARHAGARTVGVHVATSHADHDDGTVSISVVDDGEGIPAEVLPRIFEPHFSTRTSGSGLGLAISRRLVDGWGGSIAVRSEPGVGTTVTVSLRSAPGA